MARVHPDHQRRLDASAYILRILEGTRPHPVAGSPVAARNGIFKLPVNPQTFSPQQDARVAFMQTRDGAISDVQGASPPTWTIDGQFLLTPDPKTGLTIFGYQRALEEFIRYYFDQNRERSAKRKPLLRMVFDDTYSDTHWYVEPLNIPLGTRSNAAPTIERYALRLRGTKPFSSTTKKAGTIRTNVLSSTDVDAVVRDTCPFWNGTTCSQATCPNRVGAA